MTVNMCQISKKNHFRSPYLRKLFIFYHLQWYGRVECSTRCVMIGDQEFIKLACSHAKYAMRVKALVDYVCKILVTKISIPFNINVTRNVTRVWVETAYAFDLLPPNLGILFLHVLEIRLIKWALTRFPFTINSISVEFVQHWLRVAIVKGFLRFENEWFEVIVHPWGVICVNANSPDGHQKVKPCVQHFAEYVKHQSGPQPELDIWWRHPNFQHGAQTKGHDPGSLFSSLLRL